MKKVIPALLGISALAMLSSCGVSNALIVNHNANTTQVVLGSNNFRVVDKVSGQSSVTYICMIGGSTKKQLFRQAYAEMMENANLKNSSKAVINVTTEEHVGGVPPFYFVRTVTVSGNVVEFVK